jgi:hypothetical protein
MKKVTATIIYRNNTIYNLTVNHRGVITPLVTSQNPVAATSFADMYERALRTIKNNNFYCGYFEAFGGRWYDIQFINLDEPYIVDTHGIKEV